MYCHHGTQIAHQLHGASRRHQRLHPSEYYSRMSEWTPEMVRELASLLDICPETSHILHHAAALHSGSQQTAGAFLLKLEQPPVRVEPWQSGPSHDFKQTIIAMLEQQLFKGNYRPRLINLLDTVITCPPHFSKVPWRGWLDQLLWHLALIQAQMFWATGKTVWEYRIKTAVVHEYNVRLAGLADSKLEGFSFSALNSFRYQ